MNHYILPSPAPPVSYLGVEAGDQSPASPATSRRYSWSMESEPQQIFTDDAAFWQDISTFICSSPQNSLDYRSDDVTCTSPTSPNQSIPNAFKPVETASVGTSQPRVRGQTLELLLKRRAQNRASQRAYRDRRDQHVRELQTQYDAMAARNEALESEYETLFAAHEALRAECEAMKAECEALKAGARARLQADVEAEEEAEAVRAKEAAEAATEAVRGMELGTGIVEEDEGHGEGAVWKGAPSLRLSQMLGMADEKESLNGHGGANGGGLMVKVIVCKRCFGDADTNSAPGPVKAKCED